MKIITCVQFIYSLKFATLIFHRDVSGRIGINITHYYGCYFTTLVGLWMAEETPYGGHDKLMD